VISFCEHRNEHSDSTEGKEHLNWMNDCQLGMTLLHGDSIIFIRHYVISILKASLNNIRKYKHLNIYCNQFHF
jgi:hypothetical protein